MNIDLKNHLDSAIKHVKEYLDMLDVAIDCENRIVAAYQTENEIWDKRWNVDNSPTPEPSDGILMLKIRVMLDAKANARRIQKDRDAIASVLGALDMRIDE